MACANNINTSPGKLPAALGSLAALEELVLNDNMLTGERETGTGRAADVTLRRDQKQKHHQNIYGLRVLTAAVRLGR